MENGRRTSFGRVIKTTLLQTALVGLNFLGWASFGTPIAIADQLRPIEILDIQNCESSLPADPVLFESIDLPESAEPNTEIKLLTPEEVLRGDALKDYLNGRNSSPAMESEIQGMLSLGPPKPWRVRLRVHVEIDQNRPLRILSVDKSASDSVTSATLNGMYSLTSFDGDGIKTDKLQFSIYQPVYFQKDDERLTRMVSIELYKCGDVSHLAFRLADLYFVIDRETMSYTLTLDVDEAASNIWLNWLNKPVHEYTLP